MRRARRAPARTWRLDRTGVAWVAIALAGAATAWRSSSPMWLLGAAVHLATAAVVVRARARRRLRRRLGVIALWAEGLGLWGRTAALVIGAALWTEARRLEEARRASGGER